MLASSVEHGLRACSCRPVRAIRDLSPSIARKRKFLAVDLTVSPAYPDKKSAISGAYKCRRQLSGSDRTKALPHCGTAYKAAKGKFLGETGNNSPPASCQDQPCILRNDEYAADTN